MYKKFNRGRGKKPESSALIYGINPIAEALEAGKEIDKLYIQRDIKNDHLKSLVNMANDNNVPIAKVPLEKLNKFTLKAHQGAVAFLSSITYASLDNIITNLFAEGKTPFILILDQITDVRNFGAISRTAECAGVNAIVIPHKGAAQIGPDALKTSAGALNHIQVCREVSLKDTVRYLQDSGLQVIACTEKAEEDIYKIDYTIPTAIIMGSEETGISNDLIRIADELAKIPMSGKVSSLNVSVATGTVLFEAVRQKIKAS
ncbi:23S rRNA (guanosine(2251)-2'-O)-methyltransferase RlmB [Flexithrix dorotheae]|uniref:23S rRNA (guanosine(2251)-2'-O)-methyltransferase RlmB n=1 Tax=Flexithrix dorotheae TaxID=70993 RepID=UPI0005C46748|nr:23S rRNA (guanosine(2251)-2'-O)-methyltransferase RlmB [Flexithrix dorotheae]